MNAVMTVACLLISAGETQGLIVRLLQTVRTADRNTRLTLSIGRWLLASHLRSGLLGLTCWMPPKI
ncbi:hypothetical protein, partial [Xanthomonas axonopodis]|uniref:hypothetical protein n=1 Tax=Xanthomonas axonopodis TaxID=53413 RepID=UPI001C255F0B